MTIEKPSDDALERALAALDPERRQELRALVRDSSYVEPRVVSHAQD